jgi:hypothetical protein
MNQSVDNRTGFLGTYFDRGAALRIAAGRHSGMVLLAMYVYTTFVSIGRSGFLWLQARRLMGANIFDRRASPLYRFPSWHRGWYISSC